MTAPITESVQESLARDIASQAERGWDLYLAKRQLITRVDEDTYRVPASSGGQRSYTVRYGGDALEDCECVDFGVHKLACKHIVAVALIYACRRVHSRCEVCGALSRDKALVGIRGDHRLGGPRYCLPHQSVMRQGQ